MDDLIKIIDDIAVKPYVSSTRKMTGFYPSAASVQYQEGGELKTVGSCLRNLWYSFNGYTQESDSDTAESVDKRNIGEWFSKNMVERFKQAGLYVADEVPFEDPETGVRGRIDIIVKDPYSAPKPPARPQPKDLIGVEVKSTGGYYNIKGTVISTQDTPLMPKIEHVLQCMLYLGYYSKFGLDRWVLIYQDRESLKKQWHKVSMDENGSAVIVNSQQSVLLKEITLQGIKDRFKQLNQYLIDKELPPRDYELQYSNDKIIKLYTSDKLNKTDAKTVETRLKKYKNQVPDSVVLLEKGDFQCGYCPNKELCWSEEPLKRVKFKEELKPIHKTPPKPSIELEEFLI